MILFILSFVAGILTVLAPCTLPLLPVIVGSSVAGIPSKKKLFTIAFSLGLSIIIFTILLKVSSAFVSIPPEVWALVSGIIIIFFGITSLFPGLWESIPLVNKMNMGSNRLLAVGYQKENFLGNMIIGLSLGPVFSSCSPTYFVILATVLPQSLSLGLIDLFAYAVGLSGTLIVIALIGQKIIDRLGGISDTNGKFRRSLGALFVILGVMIIFGIDKKIEYSLLSNGLFDITKLEQSLLKFNEKKPDSVTQPVVDGLNNGDENQVQTGANNTTTFVEKTHGPKAPEIVRPSGFINTDDKPITIKEFKGKKVVLLDIWTYTCINCQRTLPYVESWYEKYKDMGLVVIGLHTPEFAFEKIKSNVEIATKKYGLTYPIVMDNEYATWTAYGNQYWPRKYLISGDGEIVYDHIGEGDYEETEKAIQRALSELNGENVATSITTPTNAIVVEESKVKSPEVYFGSSRNQYLGNGIIGKGGDQILSIDMNDIITPNELYLEGTWNFQSEFATLKTPGKLLFKYNAKNVYMVASSDQGLLINILLDGKMVKTLFIKANQLYTIIEGNEYGPHTLQIEMPKAGLKAFTFTFG